MIGLNILQVKINQDFSLAFARILCSLPQGASFPEHFADSTQDVLELFRISGPQIGEHKMGGAGGDV
jgi:hypothetical protein